MTFKPWDDGLGTGKGIESSNHENVLLGVSPAVLVTSDLIVGLVVVLFFASSVVPLGTCGTPRLHQDTAVHALATDVRPCCHCRERLVQWGELSASDRCRGG